MKTLSPDFPTRPGHPGRCRRSYWHLGRSTEKEHWLWSHEFKSLFYPLLPVLGYVMWSLWASFTSLVKCLSTRVCCENEASWLWAPGTVHTWNVCVLFFLHLFSNHMSASLAEDEPFSFWNPQEQSCSKAKGKCLLMCGIIYEISCISCIRVLFPPKKNACLKKSFCASQSPVLILDNRGNL
jgi:hypothetical protein